jgi:hypothetical protein
MLTKVFFADDLLHFKCALFLLRVVWWVVNGASQVFASIWLSFQVNGRCLERTPANYYRAIDFRLGCLCEPITLSSFPEHYAALRDPLLQVVQ